MLELGDYLDLSPSQARAQWQAILQRVVAAPGGRQGDFTVVETLLCFGLGLVTSPGRSGRINLRESDPNVLLLAQLFRRPPGSLALKLANLDGRRENGAKHEQELWIALTSDNLARFTPLYLVILEAGRFVGLGPDQLPDFLGAESNELELVIEANRITTLELMVSIEGEVENWYNAHPGADVASTEMSILGTARVGQQQFAYSVLRNCDFSCVFCGLGFKHSGLPPSRMLIASHIKSWRASDNRERLDLRNGLAACPTHDAAFDTFLISLSRDLRVLRADALEIAMRSDPVIERNFGSDGMREKIRLVSGAKLPGAAYVSWHRAQSLQTIGAAGYE